MITQEELKESLDYNPETGLFTWKIKPRLRSEAGDIAGTYALGYISICYRQKFYRAHRLAWLYIYGEWPENQIDHINRIRDDNRICNLRLSTNSENGQNKIKANKNNSSGLLGVFIDKRDNRIYSKITIGKKIIHLGCFKSKEKAHEAYVKAKKELHPFNTL
jgi:hypothetical protein